MMKSGSRFQRMAEEERLKENKAAIGGTGRTTECVNDSKRSQ